MIDIIREQTYCWNELLLAAQAAVPVPVSDEVPAEVLEADELLNSFGGGHREHLDKLLVRLGHGDLVDLAKKAPPKTKPAERLNPPLLAVVVPSSIPTGRLTETGFPELNKPILVMNHGFRCLELDEDGDYCSFGFDRAMSGNPHCFRLTTEADIEAVLQDIRKHPYCGKNTPPAPKVSADPDSEITKAKVV